MRRRTHSFSKSVRLRALERAVGHCEQCGQPLVINGYRFHHAVPVSQGGFDTLENCRVLCLKCHNTEAGFLMQHGRRVAPRHFFIKGLSYAAARKAAGMARIFGEKKLRRELPLEIILDPDD